MLNWRQRHQVSAVVGDQVFAAVTLRTIVLSRLDAGDGDAALTTVVAARAADIAYGIAGVS